jgi:hypothetical protein
MKYQAKLFLAPLFLILLVTIYQKFNNEKFDEVPLPNAMMQVGDEEDPNARSEFEWLRLRDPQTNEIPENIRLKEIDFVKNIPNRSQVSMKNVQGGASRLNTLNWDRRGPYNVGGRTRAMALDATDESIIIAGGVSGGMWKSVDGGATWKKTTKPEQLHSITAVAQDTRTGHTSTWYYGTGELMGGTLHGPNFSAYYKGNGIYKSTDNGESWTSLTSTASNTPQSFVNAFDYVNNVIVNPLNGYVFVSAIYGLRRSKDGGATWDALLNSEAQNAYYTEITMNSKGVLYAALSTRGIFRSADNGDTWTDITPSSFSVVGRTVIGHAPSDENTMYVISHSSSTSHPLWKYSYSSGDGSGSNGTWTDRSANIPNFGGNVGHFDSQGGYDLIIKVKPDDADFVVIGGTNVYRSSDGFSTTSNTKWIGGYATINNISMYANHHPDQHGFLFLPSDPNTAFSSHDGGISKTTAIKDDAVVWTSLSNGYYTTQFFHVAIDQSGTKPDLIMGGMQDNATWKSNVNSETNVWENDGSSGDGAFSAIAFNAQADIWSAQKGHVRLNDYRNPFNSSRGYSVVYMYPTAATGQLFINPFVLDQADDKILFYAGGSTIWRNNNIDISGFATASAYYASDPWDHLTNAAATGTISTLATSKSNPTHRLYYGSSQGKVYKLDNANSGNNSPTDITSSSFNSNAFVSNIAVNPEDGDEVMVTFSNYSVKSIFHTNDGGSTWSDISGNLEENSDGSGNGPSVASALIIKHKNTQMYFVGTHTGVYSTTSLNGASTTWVQEAAQSIGNVIVRGMAGRQSDGYIAVATHGAGVFTVSLNASPIIAAVSDVTINEDATATVTLSATDGDGDAITYSALSDINVVTTSISASILTLTPNANWNGVANITVYASDGSAKGSTTFKLTVTPVNDIAAVDDVTINQNQSAEVDLTSTFTGTTTFTAVSDTNAVTTSISASTLTLTPNANWDGVANITAYASDGTYKDSTTFKLTVIPNNKPVIAAVSDVTINEDATATVTLSATDADGDAITYSAVSDINVVTTSISAATLTLTPNANWHEVANITAYASDGTAKDSTTFKLTVTPVNDIAAVDDVTIDEDIPTGVTLTTTFDGTSTFTAVSVSDSVTASISASILTLTPNANWHGAAQIKAYTSMDDGSAKDSTSFKLTVTPVQDAPSAFGWVSDVLDTININESNLAEIYELQWLESTDVDGDTIDYLLYAQIGINPPAEQMYDTTSTLVPLTYQELLSKVFEPFPMLPRVSVKFSVIATDGIDTVTVTGDDRVVLVNRYDYLSIDMEGVPNEFTLHENYPNPFNPTTTLRFDIPEVSDITVTIFNMLGQKVRTFNLNNTPAGYHSIKWNATTDYGDPVGAGVYLYQLRANRFVKTKKMILLK